MSFNYNIPNELPPEVKELYDALRARDEEGLIRVLSEGRVTADAQDEHGRTPAMLVVENKGGFRYKAQLKVLKDFGADFTLADKNGNTVMHRAASGSRFGMVEALLEVMEDLSPLALGNNDGMTPLRLAAVQGNGQDCRLLADAGSPLEPALLGDASYSGANDALAFFLEKLPRGTDLDAFDSDTRTALMWAADPEQFSIDLDGCDEEERSCREEEIEEIKKCKLACAKLLVARGANPALASPSGETAAAIADAGEFEEMAEYLRGEALETHKAVRERAQEQGLRRIQNRRPGGWDLI